MSKILVIGDSCIDKFVYCDINRLCPEAPVPVLTPLSVIINPGMAGNVVANLESLGSETYNITSFSNTTKTRYVDNKSGQMIMRFDEEDSPELCSADFKDYFEKYKFDAVIISDYNKGFLTEDIIKQISQTCKCNTFLDTKKRLGEWCKNIDFIKINLPEYNMNKNYTYDNVIVTDGKNGADYIKTGKNYSVKEEVKVSNVSGAGDTFLAGLAYEFINTKDIEKAIEFANDCASKVIQERGVTTI